MAHPMETAYNAFEGRAAALRALVPDGTDKNLVLFAQKPYSVWRACAQLMIELEDETLKQLRKDVTDFTSAKTVAELLHVPTAVAQTLAIIERYPALLESGVLVSNERDAEGMKRLGTAVVETLIAIGSKIFLGDVPNRVLEVIEAIKSLLDGGRNPRKEQFKAAAEFKKYCEDLATAGLAWSFAVQRYLLDITNKSDVPDDRVLDLVVERAAKCSNRWWNALGAAS
jgi:hypothetical protein